MEEVKSINPGSIPEKKDNRILKIILLLFLVLIITGIWYAIKHYPYSTQQLGINNPKLTLAVPAVPDVSGDKPVSLADIHADYIASAGTSQEKANILIVP